MPAETVKFPVPLYGETPPTAPTETVVVPPLQAMLPKEADANNRDGWAMVMVVLAVQPLASVTVKFHVPAPRTKEPVPE